MLLLFRLFRLPFGGLDRMRLAGEFSILMLSSIPHQYFFLLNIKLLILQFQIRSTRPPRSSCPLPSRKYKNFYFMDKTRFKNVCIIPVVPPPKLSHHRARGDHHETGATSRRKPTHLNQRQHQHVPPLNVRALVPPRPIDLPIAILLEQNSITRRPAPVAAGQPQRRHTGVSVLHKVPPVGLDASVSSAITVGPDTVSERVDASTEKHPGRGVEIDWGEYEK